MDAGRLTPEQTRRVDELFEECLELDASQYQAHLQEACADDALVCAEVQRLLSAVETPAPWLEHAAAELAPNLVMHRDDEEIDWSGRRIGAYQVLDTLGVGGSGLVLLAERADDEYHHRVAIKLLRAGASDPIAYQRFLGERQILADLDHRHIARLLDGGRLEDGTPYLVMEYVEGATVTEYAQANQLDLPARLELFEQICAAVEAAHRRLIVHRDLKPGNVLVAEGPRVKVLDFGIAKGLAEADAGAALTMANASPLTPDYAAPEQILGEGISTATDVYALGVLLFELLTDCRPFQRGGLTASSLALEVDDAEAPHPSEVAKTPWGRELRGDLDAIVARALRREPERRYGSAHEFVLDVERYQRGLPVEAQPDSSRYRLSRFLSRHRAGVAVGALVLVLLIAGLVATFWQARIASRERDLARVEAEKAKEAAGALIDLISLAEPGEKGMDAQGARTLLERGAERLETRIGADEELRADLLHALGRGYMNLGHPEDGIPLLEESLDIRRSLGDEGVETLRVMRALGDSWASNDEYERAEDIYLEGLEITRRTLGPRDIQMTNFNEGLASLANRLEHYAEAESLFRWNLEVRGEIQGEDHVDLATTYNNMAPLMQVQGRLSEAEAAYQEALERWNRAGRANHPVAAATLNNLAIVRYGQGDLAGAIEAQERAVEIHRALGTDGVDFANSLNSLGSYLRVKGLYAEAEAMAREALERNLEIFGEMNIRTGAAHLNLGRILYDQGRFDEAESEIEIGMNSFKELTGAESFFYAAALAIRGELDLRRGRLQAAEGSLREAKQIQEPMLPAGVSRYADTCLWLGTTLTLENRLTEAEPLLRTAVVIRDSLETQTQWLSAEVESVLAECLYQQGSIQEAQLLASRSRDELVKVLGEEHPLSRQAQARIDLVNSSKR